MPYKFIVRDEYWVITRKEYVDLPSFESSHNTHAAAVNKRDEMLRIDPTLVIRIETRSILNTDVMPEDVKSVVKEEEPEEEPIVLGS